MPEPRTWAYVRLSLDEVRAGLRPEGGYATATLSLDAQRSAIARHVEHARLPGPPIEVIDNDTSAGIPLDERPNGRVIAERARDGDHIVVAKLDRMFRSTLEFLGTFEGWTRRGITLHICDLGGQAIDPRTPIGKMFLVLWMAFSEFERSVASERQKSIHRYYKQVGLSCSPKVPRGFKAVAPPGKRRFDKQKYRVVPDPEQRAVMARVVQLRDEHHLTWEKIHYALRREYRAAGRKDPVPTPTGIRRYYQSELALREQESAPPPENPSS